MAKTKESVAKSSINLVLIGLAAVTLHFNSSLADPFNAPKMWLLFLFGAWLLGQIKGGLFREIRSKSLIPGSKTILGITTAFISFNFISFIFTDSKYVGLFGDYQRRTGFLTYLFLATFLLFTARKIQLSDGSRFHYWTLGISLTFCWYGIFQHFGYDFVNWNNQYNAILGTVGNPNFAAALMGIFSVILFGFAINKDTSGFSRAISLASVFLLLLTIYFSNSLQGFLAAAVGFGVLIVTWVLQRNRIIGWSIAGFGFVGGLMSIFGILQMGPFSFLFKESVTYRGDYWRAGIRMFQDHIWFGVGLDRYGAYFREYRDVAQVLRRGPNVGTNAAHNVFIQLGATAGIFVLAAYLVLVGLIFWRGIVGLRQSAGTKQILFATFFGAWLTYLAQAIISIDNIGVAIWGWVLGGAVVGLSYHQGDPEKTKPEKAKVAKPPSVSRLSLGLSSVYAVAAIVISSLFLTAEYAQHQAGKYVLPTNASEEVAYERFVVKSLQVKPVEPKFRFIAARYFFEARMNEKAVEQLKLAIANDPREFESRDTLAMYYEEVKRPDLALPLREYIVTIDPYNVINLLALGRDLKATGNAPAAREIVDKIAAIAPESEELKSAKSELLS
jgi:O-antigen ligase